MRKICTLFALLYCGYGTAATLSYTQLSADTFQLVLNNDVPLEVGQAQSSIYASAVKICNGKKPIFGKYSFDSLEPITKVSEGSSFTFNQAIKCTDVIEAVESRKKIELSSAQEEVIKSKAKIMTDEFLSAKEAGKFKSAYEMLGSGMKSITEFPAWKHAESEYFEGNLGKLVNRDIWRTTLYNNPENSATPGLFLAVDYENSYEKSPIHCGYIVWHLPTADSEEFTVVREEYGNITTDILKNIPQENLQATRKQLGCRAF